METAIRAVGLPKQFGTMRALDGLDLEVRAGEVYGYLGPNGAGKTTTIRLLLGDAAAHVRPGRDLRLGRAAGHRGGAPRAKVPRTASRGPYP